MRRLSLLALLALGLAACGSSGGGSKGAIKITFGTSGGTMVPSSTTIAPDGTVKTTGSLQTGPKSISSSQAAALSDRLRKVFPSLRSETCPGTFPDESSQFITALGKTVTVRGTCETAFTDLWHVLSNY